jgi:hypothetical protein
VFDFKQVFFCYFSLQFKIKFYFVGENLPSLVPPKMTLISKKHFLEKKTCVKSSYYEKKKSESHPPSPPLFPQPPHPTQEIIS